jgi:hypothetical protein
MSNQVIAYSQPDGSVAVIAAAPGIELASLVAAQVPQGAPYAFVSAESLPAQNQREAWVLQGGAVVVDPDRLQPAPDFGGFLDGVIASPLYQKVLEQSIASSEVNVAFTSTMGALILAANGRPNPAALQSGLSAVLAAMTVTQADLDALQALLVAARLDGLVTI